MPEGIHGVGTAPKSGMAHDPLLFRPAGQSDPGKYPIPVQSHEQMCRHAVLLIARNCEAIFEAVGIVPPFMDGEDLWQDYKRRIEVSAQNVVGQRQELAEEGVLPIGYEVDIHASVLARVLDRVGSAIHEFYLSQERPATPPNRIELARALGEATTQARKKWMTDQENQWREAREARDAMDQREAK